MKEPAGLQALRRFFILSLLLPALLFPPISESRGMGEERSERLKTVLEKMKEADGQLVSEAGWHFPADAGEKVAEALGKENQPV